MSKQAIGFVVTMKDDIGEKETNEITSAIKMLRGVIDVKPVSKEPTEKRVEKSRIVTELKKKTDEFFKGL